MADSTIIPVSSSELASTGTPAPAASRTGLILALMGCVFAALALTSLIDDSVTIDEFGHLPVGYKVLTTGDFGYCTLNPPLMNVLSALPLLGMDMTPQPMAEHPQIEPGYNFWANGYDFMFQHAGHYQRLYIAARCVTVLLVGALGVVCFVWARTLAPQNPNVAGLLAAGLVWFSPTMLAHARLVTTDAGAACFMALAVFAFHAFLRQPTGWRIITAGVALGIAQLVKFNALLLYSAFILAATLWRVRHRDLTTRRLCFALPAIFAVSLIIINAGYLFENILCPLGSLELTSEPARAIQNLLPKGTPIPLPRMFVAALDSQLADTGSGDPSYLFGESYEGGRWYYFLALLAIKTPIPLLMLAALALAAATRPTRVPAADAFVLLLPAGTLLLVLSLFSNKQLGLRMLLPAVPLFWVWAAANLARADWTRWASWIVGAMLVWVGVETARIHPHYLAYFNDFVGGPAQGHRYALDSNLDWGQDLIRLRRWLERQGEPSVQLLYYGRVDPAVYGLNYSVPREHVSPGLVAVSVSLAGRTYLLNDHGKFWWSPASLKPDPEVFGEPVAIIGHTIRVYRIREVR